MYINDSTWKGQVVFYCLLEKALNQIVLILLNFILCNVFPAYI